MSYMTIEEIAQDVYSGMGEDDLRIMRELAPTAEDMIVFHHGVGTSIRNKYLLWDPANPYTKHDAMTNSEGIIDDPMFPDQVSHEILKRVWELDFHGEPQ